MAGVVGVDSVHAEGHGVDMGSMSLREFNEWVLSFGAIPWLWIGECGE